MTKWGNLSYLWFSFCLLHQGGKREREILGIKGDAKITTALFMVAKLSKDMISFLS